MKMYYKLMIWLVCGLGIAFADDLRPAQSGSAPGGVDPAAYARLMEENQALRRRAETLGGRVMALDQELNVTQADAARLRQQVTDLTDRLESAQRARTSAASELASLRAQLVERDRERERLTRDLERLREREQRLLEGLAVGPGAVPPERGESVSDLVRDQDRENARLRASVEQLQENADLLRRQRDRALALAEDAGALRRQRDEALALVQDAVERLDSQRRASLAERRQLELRLAEVENQNFGTITQLRIALRESESSLARLEREVTNLRRQRQVTSAPTVVLPRTAQQPAYAPQSRARTAAPSVDSGRLPPEQRRRRDMQFNIAVMEGLAGRWRASEQAYHQVLALDPLDADAHYNLGILYEQELGDHKRAMRHYQAYLQQNPRSVRAPAVKSWIMSLEMGI